MRVALVLGGADCLQSDVEAFVRSNPDNEFHGVVACNDAGYWWPNKLDAWVSIHPRYFVDETHNWVGRRKNLLHPDPESFYTFLNGRPPMPEGTILTDLGFPGQHQSGTSGLFAAKVALIDLKFDRAVLCGIPLTNVPHFFDESPWGEHNVTGFRRVWYSVLPQYRERMASMSGWTREFLGSPDKWRNGE